MPGRLSLVSGLSSSSVRTEGLYPLWPVQARAMRLLGLGPDWAAAVDPVGELFYGGEAGGGKTYLARAVAATIACIWPGSKTVIFRRTYGELEDSHIQAVRQEIPEGLARYHEGRHQLEWANDSLTLFRHCENPDDMYKYQSGDWAGLIVDEATHFPKRVIEYLGTRLRVPVDTGWRTVTLYCSNPMNVGHAYFRDEFVRAAPEGTPFMVRRRKKNIRRCFLRARLSDNPALDEDAYTAQLDISDEMTRRALMDGDWDVMAGQAFPQFSRLRHVCSPFPIPEDWPRWVSVDGGWEHPFVALWWTRSRLDGRYYIYRELSASHVRDEEQAQRILSASSGETVRSYYGDPAMWGRRSQTGTSSADEYARAGIDLQRAMNDRVQGRRRVNDLLASVSADDDRPRLQIFRTCPRLADSIAMMITDPSDPEDVQKMDGDDFYDAFRYGSPETAVETIQDWNVRHTGFRPAVSIHSGVDLARSRIRARAAHRRLLVAGRP